MGVAGLLVDVSHNVSTVALYIFCILQSEREEPVGGGAGEGERKGKEWNRGERKAKKETTCLKPIFFRTKETLNFFIDKIVF